MLQPELLDAFRTWANKDEPRVCDRACETGILGEESVTWNDGLSPRGLGYADDLGAI